jgi:CTP synthase
MAPKFAPLSLVPSGFGHRGGEGMIKTAEWACTNKTPYLGMQIAVIESRALP